MVLVASPAPGGPARRFAGSVWTALCAAGRNQRQTAAAGGFLLWPLAASPELPVAVEPYLPAQPFSGSPLQPAQLINIRGEPPLMPSGLIGEGRAIMQNVVYKCFKVASDRLQEIALQNTCWVISSSTCLAFSAASLCASSRLRLVNSASSFSAAF